MHFTGQVKVPIGVTRHIPNAACERSGCHTSAQTSKTLSLGSPAPVTFKHGSAGHTQQLCIACHASHGARKERPACRRRRPTPCRRASRATRTAPRTAATATSRRTPTGARARTATAWPPGSAARTSSIRQPLVGKHAAAQLRDQCHTQGTAVKPDGCVNCHGDHHNGLPHCVDCHRITGWIPSTFVASSGGRARAARRGAAAVQRLPPPGLRTAGLLPLPRRFAALGWVSRARRRARLTEAAGAQAPAAASGSARRLAGGHRRHPAGTIPSHAPARPLRHRLHAHRRPRRRRSRHHARDP